MLNHLWHLRHLFRSHAARPAAPPSPPFSASIVAVVTDGSQDVVVEFDREVTAISGPATDGSFNIDGDFYASTAQINPTHVLVSTNAAKNPGQTWSLSDANPTWISSPQCVPGSGTTT